MKTRARRRGRQGGFTLVEMMVVIVIIGILAAVVIKQVISHADKAKVEATKAMLSELDQTISLFKLNHNRYPENLEDLVSMPSYVEPGQYPRGGYLKRHPKDGWQNKFIYRTPGTNGQPYDIISLGEDGREGGDGYAEDLWNHEANRR